MIQLGQNALKTRLLPSWPTLVAYAQDAELGNPRPWIQVVEP